MSARHVGAATGNLHRSTVLRSGRTSGPALFFMRKISMTACWFLAFHIDLGRKRQLSCNRGGWRCFAAGYFLEFDRFAGAAAKRGRMKALPAAPKRRHRGVDQRAKNDREPACSASCRLPSASSGRADKIAGAHQGAWKLPVPVIRMRSCRQACAGKWRRGHRPPGNALRGRVRSRRPRGWPGRFRRSAVPCGTVPCFSRGRR